MLRVLILCAALAIMAPLASAGPAGQQTAQQMDRIAGALRGGDFNQALSLIASAEKAAPGNSQLWVMQGGAYTGLGKPNEALNSYRHALKLSPDNTQALQGAAQILYDRADIAGIPVLQHLILLRPDDVTSHGMLAVLEYQKGDCSEAVNHFARAASLFAARVPALHAYGVCLVRLRRFEEAAAVFGQALQAHPDDRRERLVLASVLLMAHQPDQAIATLTPVLGETPDASTLELASAAYEDLHETDKAVQVLRQALLLEPQNAGLYVDFAALSATHQSFQVGIHVVDDGLNLQPNAASLYFARGVLYVQLAQYEKAQADFDRAYELEPTQSLSIAARGLAAVEQNHLEDALAGVEEKLTKRPQDPVLQYLRADILTQQGAQPGTSEFDAAMESAKLAIRLRPTLGPAHAVLAKLYLRNEQFAQAAEQCQKALKVDPNDQTALYHLVQALRKTDRRGEIPDLLKRLAELRRQSTFEEREQNRYRLVERDADTN